MRGSDVSEAFSGAPRFFRRAWAPDVQPGQFALAPVTIYGKLDPSENREDHQHELQFWRSSRLFPAMCFSVNAPAGEYGLVGLDQVTEITEQDFLAAQQRGWENA